MNLTITRHVEVEAKRLRVEFPLRYLDEEDSEQAQIPESAEGEPGRHGDRYWLEIDIDTGKVLDWPHGRTQSLYEKVSDEGTYTLFGLVEGSIIHRVHENYVPSFMPGDHFGDYIILDIAEDGAIANWPHHGSKSFADALTEWVEG